MNRGYLALLALVGMGGFWAGAVYERDEMYGRGYEDGSRGRVWKEYVDTEEFQPSHTISVNEWAI